MFRSKISTLTSEWYERITLVSIEVHPTKFGIVVMRNQNEINPELTNKIRERRHLQIQEALSAFTFRPILQLRLQPRTRINTQNLRVIVRFDYKKDGLSIWQQVQPQAFEVESTFYPNIVLNLTPHRNQRDIVGLWEVIANISFVTAQQLQAVADSEKIRFITRLRYEPIASFQWEVVQRIDSRLTNTGELVDPRARPQNLRDISISIDDI